MVFRTDPANKLIAFEGYNCKEFFLDGIRYEFAQKPFETICFAPVKDQPAKYFAILKGQGKVLLPIPLKAGNKPKITTAGGTVVLSQIVNGKVEVNITPEISGKKLIVEI